MLGINCLVRHPDLVRDLKKFIEYEATRTLPLDGRDPTLGNLYEHMRKKVGLEIDLQTFGELYKSMDSYDPKNPMFTPLDEVERAQGETVRKIVEKKKAEVRASEIGKDNAVVSAVKYLASLVQPDKRLNPTIQRIYQDRLKKTLNRILDIRESPTQPKSVEDLLREALQLDHQNPLRARDDPHFIFGYLENADHLFTELQQEADRVATEMEDNSSYGADQFRAYADQIKNASYDLFLSNREVQQVLQQVLREGGFARVATIGGRETLVTDWGKILSTATDFHATMDSYLSQKGFARTDIDRILPFFAREFEALRDQKISDALARVGLRKNKTDVERLSALARLGVFQTAEKKIIYDALGVDSLTSRQMQEVEQMMHTFNSTMELLPEAKYSPLFAEQMNRHIRNLVDQVQEGSHGGLKAVRKISKYLQWSNSTLLINDGNAIENFSSGFGEMINTAVLNVRLLPGMVKAFANTFWDTVKGGAREGVNTRNIYETHGSVEDTTSQEELKTPQAKVGYGMLNILPRIFLTAMDNGYKASIWKSVESSIYSHILRAQGLTSEEAHAVMNETYFGNRDHIEQVAKGMEQSLVAMGIDAAKGKWRRMAQQIAVANLVSDGQYFKDALQRLEVAGKVAAGKNIQINPDMIEAVRKVAYNVAARGIGHIQDVEASGYFDRKIVAFADKAAAARRSGNAAEMAKQETRVALAYSVMKFRSGSLRWMFLNMYKSSPAMLLTTLMSDIMLNKQHELLGKSKIADRLQQLEAVKAQGEQAYTNAFRDFEQDLEKAYAVRARLARSVVQPLLSYVLFKSVLGPAFGKLMSFVCKDPSEGCLQKKMLTLKQNGWDSFITKMMPIYYQNYLYSLISDNGFGKYKPVPEQDTEKNAEMFYLRDWEKNLVEFVGHNVNQDPVFQPVAQIVKDGLAKKWDRVNIDLGQFIGRSLNVGGPLKLYDIDHRYSRSFKGMLAEHYDPKWSNKATRMDRIEEQADNIWQEIARDQLTQQMYDLYIKHYKRPNE